MNCWHVIARHGISVTSRFAGVRDGTTGTFAVRYEAIKYPSNSYHTPIAYPSLLGGNTNGR